MLFLLSAGSEIGARVGESVAIVGRVLGEECMCVGFVCGWEVEREGRWICPGFWARPALIATEV
jgi:hypothetical protein